MPGTLYLVATPIGNLEDITLRALRILKEVDLVAAEDTRHSRKLFNHYGITTPLTACHQHNEEGKGEQLLRQLQEGKSIALISDAGTPAISDPGFLLVRLCRNAGVAVTAVPGPSATVAALSISGLPVDRFAFDGFLPAKSSARREAFRRLRHEERTVLFYEAPHRLAASLNDLVLELGGEREVAVARELTKIHEELFRGTAAAVREHFGREKVRGEMVLMVAPAPPPPPPTETVAAALTRVAAETGLPMKGVVKLVAKAFGLPGDEVYKAALAMKEGKGKKG
ncbi:MAG: 16S rRNA (cytidine(1402)-2'-O)-methyltransferase [Desulfuromonadales bacterium GWD2_61_12]|nr:MAG: 16S rRNA (cytidine(1402)-2'-O)-methyltransferase [Desulfuromonadales bacterium GWD2_61_12]HBT83795.1 16S rRNA (cytidine(1402)-2'-O)-methyltransferase [Desulfuromonas sp.]